MSDAEKFVETIKLVLGKLGADTNLKFGPGDDEGSFRVEHSLFSLDMNVDVPVNTFASKKTCKGHRLYTWKVHAATRWQPEDAEDVTVYEGPSAYHVLRNIGHIIVEQGITEVLESQMPVEPEIMPPQEGA